MLRKRVNNNILVVLGCCVFGILYLALPETVVAQQYASVGIGSNSYVGDLSPVKQMGQLNVSIRYMKKLDNNLGIQATLHIGDIEGEYDPGDPVEILNTTRQPNTYFSTHINSVDVGLKWAFVNASWVQLNGSIGLGILSFTIRDEEDRNLNDRSETRLPREDYSLLAAYVPAAAGIVFFPERQISIEIEQVWNFTNTDYLDNISYLSTDPGNDYIIRRFVTLRYRL